VSLVVSVVYALFLFLSKNYLLRAPSDYESMMANVQTGLDIMDKPGLFRGVFSGFVSPFSLIVGFLDGLSLAHINDPSEAIAGFDLKILSFYVYGNPYLHFGVWYNCGYIFGLHTVFIFILGFVLNYGGNSLPDE
jgi:hypothetical protein